MPTEKQPNTDEAYLAYRRKQNLDAVLKAIERDRVAKYRKALEKFMQTK